MWNGKRSRSGRVFVAAILVTCLAPAAAATAASGDLDPTFSEDGKRTTSFPGTELAGDHGNAVAVQDDGKIVVVGDSGESFNRGDIEIARYESDGDLDDTFSGDGRRTTDIGARDEARAVAIEDDGQIVVAGETGGTSADFAVVRYEPNGRLDESFSGDGIQTTTFGGDEEGYDVAINPVGEILVAGETTAGSGPGTDFALARYKPNGAGDATFGGGDGTRTTDFGDDDSIQGVALQDDGKIVAAGYTYAGAGRGANFALARYRPDGRRLDDGFAGDGRQTTDFGQRDGGQDLAITATGRIVVVGNSFAGPDPGANFALARYRSDGRLDDDFSRDGRQLTDFQNEDSAESVAIQDDGKIVAAGRAGGGSPDFALARYERDGQLDGSFAGDGRQTTHFRGSDLGEGVAIQNDGRIVAAGYTLSSEGGSDFAVARYLP